jgi:hypothetical protein
VGVRERAEPRRIRSASSVNADTKQAKVELGGSVCTAAQRQEQNGLSVESLGWDTRGTG